MSKTAIALLAMIGGFLGGFIVYELIVSLIVRLVSGVPIALVGVLSVLLPLGGAVAGFVLASRKRSDGSR